MAEAAGVTLHELDSSHIEAYRRLRLEALRALPTAYGSGYETQVATKASQYRHGLSGSAENYVLGAWEAERLVGIAGFVREVDPKRSHIGLVWGIYVKPEYRGAGVGRRLLRTILDRARALHGIRHLLVTVVSDNEAAAGFYRSLGFKAWGIEPAALQVEGELYDEIHMLLEL